MNKLFYLSGGLALYIGLVFVFNLQRRNIIRNLTKERDKINERKQKGMTHKNELGENEVRGRAFNQIRRRKRKEKINSYLKWFEQDDKYSFIISLLILFFNISASYILLEYFENKVDYNLMILKNGLASLVAFIIFLIISKYFFSFSFDMMYYIFGVLSFLYFFYVVYKYQKTLKLSNLYKNSDFNILSYLNSSPIKYIAIMILVGIAYFTYNTYLKYNQSPKTYRFLGERDKKYYLRNGTRRYIISPLSDETPYIMTIEFSLYLDALQHYSQFDDEKLNKFTLISVLSESNTEILSVYVSNDDGIRNLCVSFLPDLNLNNQDPIITFDDMNSLYQSLKKLKIVVTETHIALFVDDKNVEQKKISNFKLPDVDIPINIILVGEKQKLLHGYITNAYYMAGYEQYIQELSNNKDKASAQLNYSGPYLAYQADTLGVYHYRATSNEKTGNRSGNNPGGILNLKTSEFYIRFMGNIHNPNYINFNNVRPPYSKTLENGKIKCYLTIFYLHEYQADDRKLFITINENTNITQTITGHNNPNSLSNGNTTGKVINYITLVNNPIYLSFVVDNTIKLFADGSRVPDIDRILITLMSDPTEIIGSLD